MYILYRYKGFIISLTFLLYSFIFSLPLSINYIYIVSCILLMNLLHTYCRVSVNIFIITLTIINISKFNVKNH